MAVFLALSPPRALTSSRSLGALSEVGEVGERRRDDAKPAANGRLPRRAPRLRTDALLGDGVARLVQRLLDALERHLSRLVAQAHGLARQVHTHRIDAGQRAEGAVNRLHAMLAAHIRHAERDLARRSCLHAGLLTGGSRPPSTIRGGPFRLLRLSQSTRRAKPRSRNEFVTTVTEESAIAAAAKIGALSRSHGIAGEAIASGIRTVL